MLMCRVLLQQGYLLLRPSSFSIIDLWYAFLVWVKWRCVTHQGWCGRMINDVASFEWGYYVGGSVLNFYHSRGRVDLLKYAKAVLAMDALMFVFGSNTAVSGTFISISASASCKSAFPSSPSSDATHPCSRWALHRQPRHKRISTIRSITTLFS